MFFDLGHGSLKTHLNFKERYLGLQCIIPIHHHINPRAIITDIEIYMSQSISLFTIYMIHNLQSSHFSIINLPLAMYLIIFRYIHVAHCAISYYIRV